MHDPISAILYKSYQKRKKYVFENSLEAYRLLHLEESFLPIAIDIYKENAVIHLFQKIEPETIDQLRDALEKLLHIESFFFKNRTKEEMDFPGVAAKKITIHEYGHEFLINLSDYLDTGLFLDHRETRKWIQTESKNKKVLNTFAYTGSFSVYAAAGGAEKTFSVDLSKTYCEWIKENLELNHLPPEKNWVYKMDTLEFFKYARKKNMMFDIIIIDPPTFSKNKGKHFSVQKDHPELLNRALEILEPGGFILFSNNCKTFRLEKNKIGADSEPGSDARSYEDAPSHMTTSTNTLALTITEKKDTIPPDFPGLKPHHCFIIAKK